MVFRVLQFLLGVLLAGGGGYLAWTERAGAANLFPPGPSGLPVLLLAALLGLLAGLVFLVIAVHPRPNQQRRTAEKATRDETALGEAEAYYSERSRAADRDWRAGEIAPLPQTATPPTPPPPPPAAPPPPANPFPSPVTLSPIPRGGVAVAPAVVPPVVVDGAYPAIRTAIAAGKLVEAEAMLNAARETAAGLELAQLTAIAGDHAAASGQQSHARWLWRLAMKRFGELDATSTPEAARVAASLSRPA